ncbi:hypothetical protein B0G76_7319 [Paraburkholderia sp. BL23I1N1]|nr:hypothetical protein B0G76_7319 [Paraburkholderia sp. BL23I1N1]
MNLLDGRTAHAGTRRHRNRRETGEIDHDDLRRFVDAEPDHHQRQIRKRRQRPIELQRRIQQTARNPAHAHRDSNRHSRDRGQRERAEHAQRAPREMFGEWQTALNAAVPGVQKRGPDSLGRRQKQRRQPVQMRSKPPKRRERRYRDCAQRRGRAFARQTPAAHRPRFTSRRLACLGQRHSAQRFTRSRHDSTSS